MACQNSDGDHQKGAKEHGIIRVGKLQKKNVQACPGNGCAGINMLFQDKGRFTCHDIPQDAAADTGNDAKEDDKKMIFPIPCIYSGVNPGDGKCPKADGIQDIHDLFVAFHVVAPK